MKSMKELQALRGLRGVDLPTTDGERIEAFIRDGVRPEDGWLYSAVFSDPGIYDLELERIFRRSWLFVGHETEVPSPGDYVCRKVGERPAIMVRGEDGVIRVLLNVCRHRGMQVCRSDLGNASHFRCPYHAWTYKNTGELVGVPYGTQIYRDLDKSELPLVAAHTEVYAGLVFASWAEDPLPLTDYLGGMKWYLDILAGRAEMEVLGPPQRIQFHANWKVGAENFASDGLHTASTHASVAALGLVPHYPVSTVRWAQGGYMVSLENGHGLMLGMPSKFVFCEELIPEYKQRLAEGQYEVFEVLGNMPGTVFPNLSFLISSVTVKGTIVSHTNLFLWNPMGPDKTELMAWFLVEKNAPDHWKELSRQIHIATFGASGVLQQDDIENWSNVTGVCRDVRRDRFVFDYGLGLDVEPLRPEQFPGPGTVYEGKYNEANARNYYRQWKRLMLENG